MTTPPPPSEPSGPRLVTGDEPRDELTWQAPVIDVLIAFARSIKFVIIVLALAGYKAFSDLQSLIPEYTATSVSVILPREKPVFDASIATASFETTEARPRSGSALPFTLPSNVDMYVMLMKSRGNLERVAEQFVDELIEIEEMPADHRSSERASFLSRMTKFEGSEDGLISVTVTARDPELAASMANAFTEASDIDSRNIERGLLHKQAQVLEHSAQAALGKLKLIEEEFATFSKKHGFLDPKVHAATSVAVLTQREFEETKTKALIEALKETLTPESERVREEMARLESIQGEIAEIKEEASGVAMSELGALEAEYQDLQQRLSFRRDLWLVLTSQAEIYRIRAEQASGPLVVVRPASVPIVPAGPSKKKTVIIPVFLGLFFSVCGALFFEALRQIRERPALSDRIGLLWTEFKRSFFIGREPKKPKKPKRKKAA